MPKTDTAIAIREGIWRALLFLLVLLGLATSALAQPGLHVSVSSDFSTQDRLFGADDVMYIRVDAGPRLDLATVTESSFRLEPRADGEEFEGVLEIREDGSLVGHVPVSDLEGTSIAWLLTVSIEDGFYHEYRARTAILIRTDRQVPQTFRFSGTVESATATSITVGGREFVVTSDTEIHHSGSESPDPSDLVGMHVVVMAQQEADGSVTAIQVFAESRRTVQFFGPIDDVDAVSVTVHGTTFLVTERTTIKTWTGAPVVLEDLTVGTYAFVTAVRTDGGWIAAGIVTRGAGMLPDDREREIEGLVEAVGGTTISVSGMELTVTEETVFDGASGLADIEPGAYVEVTFVVDRTTGIRFAMEIEVEDRGDDEGEDEEDRDRAVEVEGVITALTDQSVTVEGIEFTVTSETEIQGDADVQLVDLYRGLYVEVRGRLEADGSLRAIRIGVEDDEEAELTVRGEITATEGAQVTIGETPFQVTASTRIHGDRGIEIGIEDLEVGLLARADLEMHTGGTLVAVSIRVEHEFGSDDVKIAGLIEAVLGTELIVHGVTFSIADDTEIEDVRGNALGAADLQVGQGIRIEAERQPDGTYVAEEVRVLGRIHYEGRFAGVVTSTGDGEIHVNGTVFAITSETILDGVSSAADVVVGDRVKLRYRVLGDGSRLALRVRVGAIVETDTELSGVVDAVASGSIQVAGVQVFVTAATRVFDEDGRPIPASRLKSGQTLEIEGTSIPAGVVAARIQVDEAVVVSGAVATHVSTGLEVAGRHYATDDETLIVGRGNARLSLDELGAGAYVEIIATRRTAGGSSKMGGSDEMYAERVLVLQTAAATARENGDVEVPNLFTLKQNYPNPFNPSTNITFEVASTGDRDVLLTVFDVLGRKVRTLVDASLSPGAHSYVWNGVDDSGRPVPSGIYFYRLEVGAHAATRSMTLIK